MGLRAGCRLDGMSPCIPLNQWAFCGFVAVSAHTLETALNCLPCSCCSVYHPCAISQPGHCGVLDCITHKRLLWAHLLSRVGVFGQVCLSTCVYGVVEQRFGCQQWAATCCPSTCMCHMAISHAYMFSSVQRAVVVIVVVVEG